jgi:hypothetical protein
MAAADTVVTCIKPVLKKKQEEDNAASAKNQGGGRLFYRFQIQ